MWDDVSRHLGSVFSGGSRWFLLDALWSKYLGAGHLNHALREQREGRGGSLARYALRVIALGAAEFYFAELVLRPNEGRIRAVVLELLGWMTRGQGQAAEPPETQRLRHVLQLLQARDSAMRPAAGAGHTGGKSCGASEEGDDARQCSICMDASVQVAVQGCGHRMCAHCAKSLLQSQQAMRCPFCRGELAFQPLTEQRAQRGQHGHASCSSSLPNPQQPSSSSYRPLQASAAATHARWAPLQQQRRRWEEDEEWEQHEEEEEEEGWEELRWQQRQQTQFSPLDVCPPPDFLPRNVYCDERLFLVS